MGFHNVEDTGSVFSESMWPLQMTHGIVQQFEE